MMLGMVTVREVCAYCKGKKFKKNIDRKTGSTACFACKGAGYLTRQVDEDEAARIELMALPKERLALVDCDRLKWQCRVEACEKYTGIRDYGAAPYYHTRWGWLDLSRYYMRCFAHAKRENAGEVLPLKAGNGENHLIPLRDDRV